MDEIIPLKYQLEGKFHVLVKRKLIKYTTCAVCDKRIPFGKSSKKCKDCKAVCHIYCAENLPLPCVPSTDEVFYKIKFVRLVRLVSYNKYKLFCLRELLVIIYR